MCAGILGRTMQAGASGTASNVKSSAGGRERREALKAQLRVTNAEAVPKVDEALAEFYARTCASTAHEKMQMRLGSNLTVEAGLRTIPSAAHWTREAFARDQQHVGTSTSVSAFGAVNRSRPRLPPRLPPHPTPPLAPPRIAPCIAPRLAPPSSRLPPLHEP